MGSLRWKYCFSGMCMAVAMMTLHFGLKGLPHSSIEYPTADAQHKRSSIQYPDADDHYESPSHQPPVVDDQQQCSCQQSLVAPVQHKGNDSVDPIQHKGKNPVAADPHLEVLERRKEMLRQKCKEWDSPDDVPKTIDALVEHIYGNTVPKIIVNDKYKILFCMIHKCSSTNMRRLFTVLATDTSAPTAKVNVHVAREDRELTMLGDMSPSDIKKRLLTYTKLIVVREPLQRVLSAYRNGRTEIIYNFTDFIDRMNRGYFLGNHHYKQYTKLCFPCSIDYDLIFDVESVPEDFETMKTLLGIDPRVDFPARNATGYKYEKSSAVFDSFLQQLNYTQLDNFWKTHRGDYTLFGYAHPYKNIKQKSL